MRPFPRLIAFAVTALLSAGVSIPASASGRCHLVAHLSSRQIAPAPAGAPTFGAAEFAVDTAANTLAYRIIVGGLTSAETSAQIRGFAPPGATGAVLHSLPAGPVKIGVFNYSESQEADIVNGGAYILINTASNPQGELRGQIVTHVTDLSPNQTPGGPTAGSGWGTFVLDTCANTLAYHIVVQSTQGVETTAALHAGAIHTETAASVHTLPLGTVKDGVWNYPESLEQSIEDGLVYVNIRSTLHPNGALRGQVVCSLALMDRLQVVNPPPVPSSAIGIGFLSLDRVGSRLGYDVRLTNISGGGEFTVIHAYAPPGTGAPSQHSLPSGDIKVGRWFFGPTNLQRVLDRLVYIDTHTDNNPDGEVRGQVNIIRVCPERGDANDDEAVNFADVTSVLSTFGAVYLPPVFDPANPGDANDDLGVTFADITSVLSTFGACYR